MSGIGRALARCNILTRFSTCDVLPRSFLLHKQRRPAFPSFLGVMHMTKGDPPGVPPAKYGQVASKDEARDFLAVFPDLVQDLTNIGSQSEISEAQKWFAKVLQYNIIGGKMNRGLAVALSLKQILPLEEITPELLRKANIMGWCIELLQSHFLIVDDIMDSSEKRRGKLCWYKNEGIGLSAINDSLLLNAGIYRILNTYFKNEPYYLDVVELFHDITMKTIIGQTLDLKSCPLGHRPEIDKFTMERYNAIIKYKTSYYSFYLPVAMGMFMAEITDRELHRQARTILLEMGSFFQVQDDYLDCFGDPLSTGKVGNDIAEGKCTWLAVVALQRASNAQRNLMKEFYGCAEPEAVSKIRELYKELNLPATYRAYEESTSSLIRIHIQQISRGLNHNVFFKFMDKIYKRSR